MCVVEGDTRIVGEDELVPISALQHMLYCPRQCALIHIERQWAENRFTAEGRILHKRADAGIGERRSGVKIERSVPLRSLRLGVSGLADMVEMQEAGTPYPVEYKRGRPKAHRADEVQLCAQAICLEEMLDVPVPQGALFYRPQPPPQDGHLRCRVARTHGAHRGRHAAYARRQRDAATRIRPAQMRRVFAE